MKSLDKNKTKELEYVITWVMAKANGIDDYNWGQKQFEKDLRKKLELLLTQQRTELEQQKVKVVWNDVCEQIKKDTIEQILNLGCLKEEEYELEWSYPRNQLRNEIKKEIEKL